MIGKVNSNNNLIAVPLYNQHLSEWYEDYDSIDFEDWWQGLIIKVDGHEFTREKLIKLVSNKDGGAHVNKDGNLPSDYCDTKLTQLNMNILGISTDFQWNVVYASVAQIGWEILNSINEADL